MEKKVNILGCSIDKLTLNETVAKIYESIESKNQIHHTVVNAGKIVMMDKDEELKQSVISADIINPDGMGIVWASKFLSNPLPERVTGIDLMQSLVAKAKEKNKSIYFLGAKEEVVAAVVEKYTEDFGPEIIAGYRNGYFDKSEERSIAEAISESGADLLFVAISSPKKENFLYNNKALLSKVYFIMGVGGSFDVVSGKIKRAPVWVQKVGMEWFFRFAQEPSRMWKRYLIGNFRFAQIVIKEKFSRE